MSSQDQIFSEWKLVPVEPTKEMKKAIYGLLSAYDDGSDISPSFFMKMLINSAPTPPQPIYDEAKERGLFEVHYRDQFEAETGRELSDEDIKSMRDGPLYGQSRTYLNGQWVGWQACAQSRAKAGEDE